MRSVIYAPVTLTQPFVPTIKLLGNTPAFSALKTDDIVIDLLGTSVMDRPAGLCLIVFFGGAVYDLCGYYVIIDSDVFDFIFQAKMIQYGGAYEKSDQSKQKP